MVIDESLRSAQGQPESATTGLRRHIDEALSRGATRKDLEIMLLKAGWPKEMIRGYLGISEEVNAAPGLIRLRDVTKRFGDNVVLDHVTLDIPPGEMFGIIGLSGVGKTTLLNVLVGFLEPDSGEVLIKLPDGTEASVSKQMAIIKSIFGFAAQVPSFYGQLTVRENIEHFAALYNIPQEECISRCDRLLRMVGLEKAEHTLAQNLSGGMQKRLDIACALVHRPAILILDEPTADLDNIIRDQIWDIIRKINAQGTTVIVASHVVSELEQYCSRIGILRNQRISEVGTTAQLRDIYSKQYEIFLKTAQKDYAALRSFCSKKRPLFAGLSERDDCFVVQTSQPQAAMAQLLAFLGKRKEQVVHLQLSRPSIAEVFEALVKNESHPLH